MAPMAFSSCRGAPATSTRCVVARAQGERRGAATVGLAAAVLLSAAPAFAGVTYADKGQKVRNYTKPDEAPAVSQSLPNPVDKLKDAFKSATGGDNPVKDEGPKKSEPAEPGVAFNTQALWPLGLVAVGGALFAAPKVDPGFDKIFETGWVKDSSMKGFGIGTEDVLKEKGGYMAAYYPAGEPEKGTKAIRKERDPKKVPGKRQKKGWF